MNGLAANPLALIGRVVIAFLAQTGRLASFTWSSVSGLFTPPFFIGAITRQMMVIGYYSLPVVGMTAFFTGGVLALQISLGSDRAAGTDAFVPQIVVLAITRELGPVLAGLMVAGRVSAAIAAEIGTMRVTEQIDALVTLSTNPFKYLILPRLLAAVNFASALGSNRRCHRCHGRLGRCDPIPRFFFCGLHHEHCRLCRSRRRHIRTLESGDLWVRHRFDGLLQRLLFARRRSRRRPSDNECSRVGVGAYPGL